MSRVKNFLENYDNVGTRRKMKVSLNKFFQSLHEEANLDNLDEIAEKYFSEKRDYARAKTQLKS